MLLSDIYLDALMKKYLDYDIVVKLFKELKTFVVNSDIKHISINGNKIIITRLKKETDISKYLKVISKPYCHRKDIKTFFKTETVQFADFCASHIDINCLNVKPFENLYKITVTHDYIKIEHKTQHLYKNEDIWIITFLPKGNEKCFDDIMKCMKVFPFIVKVMITQKEYQIYLYIKYSFDYTYSDKAYEAIQAIKLNLLCHKNSICVKNKAKLMMNINIKSSRYKQIFEKAIKPKKLLWCWDGKNKLIYGPEKYFIDEKLIELLVTIPLITKKNCCLDIDAYWNKTQPTIYKIDRNVPDMFIIDTVSDYFKLLILNNCF